MISKNQKGFTLLELLIAAVIFTIAVAGMGNVTLLAVKSFRRQQMQLLMMQNAEFALDRIAKEVSTAVFKDPAWPAPAFPPKFVVTDDAAQGNPGPPATTPERLDFNAWIYTASDQSNAFKGGDVGELHYRIFNDAEFGYTLQRQVQTQDKTASPAVVVPNADILNPSAADKGNIIAFYCDDIQIQSYSGGWVDNWDYPSVAQPTLPDRVRVTIHMYDPDGEVSGFNISADVSTRR